MLTLGNFNLRVVRSGEKYGREECLIHGKDDPLVEFYDKRYPHTQYGQFVSRYYASTLAEMRDDGSAFSLDGGIPEWTVPASDVGKVIAFASGAIARA